MSETDRSAQDLPAVGSPLDGGVRPLALLLACLWLVGCGDEAAINKRGVARAEMFRECMGLAAKMPRLADDDVADVVHACANQAMYMTNYIK